VNRIVTNPPWGVRLAVGDLTPYWRAWRQVLAPDGVVVALLSQEQAALLETGWTLQAAYDISVAGRHPRIVVLTPQRIEVAACCDRGHHGTQGQGGVG
jgi:hypothetical protein